MQKIVSFLFLVLLVSLSQSGVADVTVTGLFTDHMVLQRQMPIRIWGTAEPGEKVIVSFGEQSSSAVADNDGSWKTELRSMEADNIPRSIVIQGKNRIEIKDVLVGEVWLCSGQSNMEWSVDKSANALEEIANANHPAIRHIKLPRRPSPVPLIDVNAKWEVCSPETVAKFTAAGYFAARHLSKELQVPIGLINSSWGGTRVEPWTCLDGFANTPKLQSFSQSVHARSPGTEAYKSLMTSYMEELEQWQQSATENLGKGESIKASPDFPAALQPLAGRGDPTALYNGMIHPLVGFSFRGAFWYQGEANRKDGSMYFEKKKALINGWRNIWQQGDFPFYFVQLAPFQYGNEDPTGLARMWEAQAATQQLPNTGMVVTNDIATPRDIHPPNKQDVGLRLAMLALNDTYGRTDLVARSPDVKSTTIKGDQLIVTFKHTGGRLATRDSQPPSHFEIIGVDSGGYQAAQARIEGNSVILTSSAVKAPTAFRFAWNKLAEPNLTGATGLPVGAFRAGDEPTFFQMIPNSNQYQLVLEMDLANLSDNIQYNLDERKSVSKFDRIGYLVELNSAQYGDQKMFVSMNAFTDDVQKIGVPVFGSGIFFQQKLDDLKVWSNEGKFKNLALGKANIEFWPNNYGPQNTARIPKANNRDYDSGDSISELKDGYGSMQIHAGGENIFAINHWRDKDKADIGIGNNSQRGQAKDWTFTKNADTYDSKRLKVYIRPAR